MSGNWEPGEVAERNRRVFGTDPTAALAGMVERPKAKGRIKPPKGQNKSELLYQNYLEAQKRVGVIAWFRWEGISLRLGEDCRLTIDFCVMLPDGTLELHDVKRIWRGQTKPHVEDDAAAKMRVAAELFPFVIKTVFPLPSGAWGSRTY